MYSEEQEDAREYYKETCLTYILLRQSCKQHNKLKTNIQNDFTTGDDRTTKKLQMTLHLLYKSIKNPVVSQPTS